MDIQGLSQLQEFGVCLGALVMASADWWLWMDVSGERALESVKQM